MRDNGCDADHELRDMASPPTASIEEITAGVAGQTVPRRFLETVAAHPDVVALREMAGDGPESWRSRPGPRSPIGPAGRGRPADPGRRSPGSGCC